VKIDIQRNEISEYLKELLYHVKNDSVALLDAAVDEVEPGVWRLNLNYKILE
jgi:hypothetical protein